MSDDEDEDSTLVVPPSEMSFSEWVAVSAGHVAFLRENLSIKPRVVHSPGADCCLLFFKRFAKMHYNIKPVYGYMSLVWKVDPHTRKSSTFFKARSIKDEENILNHRSKPQDRVTFFPFSYHILMIAEGKIPCDLQHNWSSRVDDTFLWPCKCPPGTPKNALWQKDKEFTFPITNTSGWVSEPGYLTPFEVLPSATILSSASPAPRIYKRRKTRFSDRKGNR
jgi:hypothetical protein